MLIFHHSLLLSMHNKYMFDIYIQVKGVRKKQHIFAVVIISKYVKWVLISIFPIIDVWQPKQNVFLFIS